MNAIYRQLKYRFTECGLIFLIATLLFLPLTTSQVLADNKATKQTHYHFGVVPQFGQRKLFSIWMPILQMLEAETGLKFKLVGSEQISAFEDKFSAGEFDFSYMNPYHAVLANRVQQYMPIIRDGARKLQAIIVVKNDSPIRSVNELMGKEVAFPSANALASLLSRAELLRKHGVKIKPRYVKTHSSVYIHVAQGLISAGGGVESTLKQQKPEITKLLRVLYRTHTQNPHPIVAHPRVPDNHVKQVQAALIAMSQRKDGQKLLSKVPMLKATIATLDDYNPISMLRLNELDDSEVQ